MSSFYNVVPPWHPGYTDPTSVAAEGLVRGTFTTKQMPRGTYDDPAVGTGGYQVPEYVMDEGYGQGALVTKQMPRGETVIPDPRYFESPTTIVSGARRVRGGTEYKALVAMGDVAVTGAPPLPEPGRVDDPIRVYGQRAARIVSARLRRLPPADRTIALRALFDTVDPDLWGKVAKRAEKYTAQGQSAQAAFEKALASSFSDGIVGELVTTGKTMTAPEPASLMGLGCYGCSMALGEATAATVAATPQTGATGTPVQEIVEILGFPVSNNGFRENITTHHTPLHPQSPTGGKLLALIVADVARLSKIGVADEDGDITVKNEAMLRQVDPAAYARLQTLKARVFVAARDVGADKWFPGIAPNAVVRRQLFSGKLPILKTKDPATGKDWGLYINSQVGGFQLHFKEVPPPARSLLGKIWYALQTIHAVIKKISKKIHEAVVAALDELGGAACDLLNTKGAPIAAGAAAAYYGAPPEAGMKGADIGKQMCNGPQQPMMMPPAPPPSVGVLPVVAGLAVAGGALWYFTRRGHR